MDALLLIFKDHLIKKDFCVPKKPCLNYSKISPKSQSSLILCIKQLCDRFNKYILPDTMFCPCVYDSWQTISITSKNIPTHSVRRSSASGNSVASLRLSYDILSLGRWFQANSTVIWKVVTSTSYLPTSLLNVIWNTGGTVATRFTIVVCESQKRN